ncbi:MAG: hypothetical protein ACK4VO_12165 [Pseudobdellovibrio sp.]
MGLNISSKLKKNLIKMVFVVAFIFVGCASPRVWVISQDSSGGVIGYQNYDPQSDGGHRIKKLLQCQNHKLISNPLKTGYSAPTIYQAYNSGYGLTTVYPIDGGSYEWREYYYQCLSNNYSHETTLTEDACVDRCKQLIVTRIIPYWISISQCVERKICQDYSL